MRATQYLVLSFFFLVPQPGCQPSRSAAPAAPSPAVPAAPKRLTGGLPSLSQLADVVLQALENGDAGTLQALRISEKEYLTHVFPEFPQAGPSNSIPADFHWFHLDMRSRSGILDAIDSFGGQKLELAAVVVTQGVDEYRTYRMHKKVELKVRHPDGRVEQIRVFGSVVEMDGEFKILSFPS
jgi:hypothetical protein